MNMSPFLPLFSGAPKSEGFCFQSERLLYGRELDGSSDLVIAVRDGTGKAEAAKLPDAGISLKQCPEKWAAEKGWPTSISRSSGPKAYWPVILLISPIEISGHSHFPDHRIR
jgi:hypothetical protein